MPQAAKKDAQSQRAQDKESKRARGALSCAECRRLKLKCDKTVPCSSCKRRGCSAICPNGSLITGQGTRFVLADTETLHQKIATMSDRIRQLEDALAILHSTVAGPTGDPHPLLHRDLLKVKSSIELHSASSASKEDPMRQDEDEDDGNGEQYIDAFGTLAIRDDGAATFYGRSAGSESLLLGEVASTDSTYASPAPSEPSPPQHQTSFSPSQSDFSTIQSHSQQQYSAYNSTGPLPASITSLAASFPLAPALSATASSASLGSSSSFTSSSLSLSPSIGPEQLVTLQTLVATYLPPYIEALRLVNLYLEQAPWFFGAVTKRQIESELLPLWYAEAAAAVPSAPTVLPGGLDPSTTGSGPLPNGPPPPPRVGTSHDLALLFVIFCFGFLTDTNLPAAPDNPPAERYYQLTKAALTLDPAAIAGATDPKRSRNGILERPPSVATVQTLSLMAIYEGICSGENSIESTWALMGLACKLSQSIGLHRDCARWKLTPAEVQKRRALFWELFITDCWQSLATGRLATFSLPFVDCELPADPDQTMADDGSVQPSFPYWKARFGAECVSAVVQGTLTSRAPRYSIILDLDRKVRDMELPSYAQGSPPQGQGLARTMSHFMPQNYRELTLLYIHRCFFAHAISTNPLDPIKSQYAPSFLAGYRSACTIIASIKLQFSMFPAQIARFWVLWTHAFSASVMLASVATHSPRSKIAPAALLELKMACDLFENASSFGGRAGKFLPIMRRLQAKAQAAYRDANNGLPAILPNDIFKPSQPNDAKDELSIFSGKTHTVSTKLLPSGGSSATSSTSSSARGTSKAPRAASDSPKSFADHPSFANAHPSLVLELNAFHGNIRAQIQNAYRSGGDMFDGMAMSIDPAPLTRGPHVRPKVSPPQTLVAPAPPPSHGQQYPHQTQPPSQQHQIHHSQQQQQQQQAMYQQAKMREEQLAQQEMERTQRERVAQQEEERREIERQELARQQQLQEQQEIQRQQQEAHRQQQLLQQQELKRQQAQHEALERQRQMEFEHQQQQEKFQQQQQHRQERFHQPQDTQQPPQHMTFPSYHAPVPAYDVSMQHSGYAAAQTANHEASVGASIYPTQTSQHPQVHHRRSSIEHMYQPQQQHYQPLVTHHQPELAQNRADVSLSTAQPHVQHPQQQHHPHVPPHPVPPQHAVMGMTTNEPTVHHHQHSVYAIPPEYSHHAIPQSIHSTSSSAGPTPPATSYGQPSNSTDASASNPYTSETYKYWPAAASSFALPDQQQTFGYPAVGHANVQVHSSQQHYQHQHYTPEAALRGIAADDRSLQETWQSYMNNVGSPRQFFED